MGTKKAGQCGKEFVGSWIGFSWAVAMGTQTGHILPWVCLGVSRSAPGRHWAWLSPYSRGVLWPGPLLCWPRFLVLVKWDVRARQCHPYLPDLKTRLRHLLKPDFLSPRTEDVTSEFPPEEGRESVFGKSSRRSVAFLMKFSDTLDIGVLDNGHAIKGQ